jgi:hypothetical protein
MTGRKPLLTCRPESSSATSRKVRFWTWSSFAVFAGFVCDDVLPRFARFFT